jgi:TatD DNase family protein
MAPAYFDTHCHLQDPRYGKDLEAVLARAGQNGITHMVCCGTRESDWPAVLELCRRHEGVLPMLGLHPWYAQDAQSGWLERLEAHVQEGTVGIGECGLDFAIEHPDRALQEAVFRSQLRLARTYDRPLSIHCRRAWERLASLATEEGLPSAGAVVHAFSGSAEVARELQRLGFHLSFSCSLANPENTRGAKAVKAVAEDHLLFETDAPDIPPRHLQGFEAGALNEPANIHLVAEAAARLRGSDLETIAALAYRNSHRIFEGLRP